MCCRPIDVPRLSRVSEFRTERHLKIKQRMNKTHRRPQKVELGVGLNPQSAVMNDTHHFFFSLFPWISGCLSAIEVHIHREKIRKWAKKHTQGTKLPEIQGLFSKCSSKPKQRRQSENALWRTIFLIAWKAEKFFDDMQSISAGKTAVCLTW